MASASNEIQNRCPPLEVPQALGHADPKQRSITNRRKLNLAPPAETRVLPVQICDSLVIQASKLGIDVLLVALAVIQLHVEHQSDAQD